MYASALYARMHPPFVVVISYKIVNEIIIKEINCRVGPVGDASNLDPKVVVTNSGRVPLDFSITNC